jgi:hypothetical protein
LQHYRYWYAYIVYNPLEGPVVIEMAKTSLTGLVLIVVLGCAVATAYLVVVKSALSSGPGGIAAPQVTSPPAARQSKSNKHWSKRRGAIVGPVKDQAVPERTLHLSGRSVEPGAVFIPLYREDIHMPAFPGASDLNTGVGREDLLRQFGDPDLKIVTSAGGKDKETYVYFSGKTDKATSVKVEDGKVVYSDTYYAMHAGVSVPTAARVNERPQ